jgi:branched-subunit amino acid aminotransferase/4-amino-4-deoxychorismate lyase
MTQFWCNGRWFDSQDFPASPLDRGIILGLGLFETLLGLDGIPVFADRHLARLHHACEKLGWTFSFRDFQATAGELLARNQLSCGRARIRLAISAGSGALDDLTPGTDRLIWMTALRLGALPESLTAALSPWPRNEHSALAGLKCASYAENAVALDRARRSGFQQSIFLNTAGQLCEAATANLFLVKNGKLLTPPLRSGCLPGITRALVIELAESLQIPCDECDLFPRDLRLADEIFLTSSIHGVTAISRLEDRELGTGPFSQLLRDAWGRATGRDGAC